MSKEQILELIDYLEKAQQQKIDKSDFGTGFKINFSFLRNAVEEYDDTKHKEEE
jgi:hypothetical protein